MLDAATAPSEWGKGGGSTTTGSRALLLPSTRDNGWVFESGPEVRAAESWAKLTRDIDEAAVRRFAVS